MAEPLWRVRLAALGVSEERALALARACWARFVLRLPEYLDREDFWAAAVAGLIRALESYDVAEGSRWSTWATYRVVWAMGDELRRQDPTARRGKSANLAMVPLDEDDLNQDATSVEEEVIQRLDRLAEDTPLRRRILWAAVARLPPVPQQIIHAIYRDGVPRPELADHLGVTFNRLLGIERTALHDLKRALERRR